MPTHDGCFGTSSAPVPKTPPLRAAAASAWAKRWWAIPAVSVQHAVTRTASGEAWPSGRSKGLRKGGYVTGYSGYHRLRSQCVYGIFSEVHILRFISDQPEIRGKSDVYQLRGSSGVTIAFMRVKVTQQRISLNGCPMGVHCAL